MTVPDQTTERRYCVTHGTWGGFYCSLRRSCDVQVLVPVERREAEQAVIRQARTVAEQKTAHLRGIAVQALGWDLDRLDMVENGETDGD